MQTDVVQTIVEKVKVLSMDQQEKVLEFVENLKPEKRTPWQILPEQFNT